MKISVIAIFYKSAPYVKRCIDSILSQKGVELELIAVNDCSPDETLHLLNEYTDCRLKVVSHQVNKGISAARNSGLKMVTGDCFYFIDGDDYLPADALAKLARYFREDVDWVGGGYLMCDEKGNSLRIASRPFCESRPHSVIMHDFGNHEFIYTHNKLINAKFKAMLFPEGMAHEDRFWNARVFNRLNHVVNVPESTYCYVMQATSFSQKSRASTMYVESGLKLLCEMDTLPSCWDIQKWTFMVTAIEKPLYLWHQPKTFRKSIIRQLQPFLAKCDLNVTNFPRFTALIHRLLRRGIPDWAIETVALSYRTIVKLTHKTV